jgi:S-layer protein (TIGR01567 family)
MKTLNSEQVYQEPTDRKDLYIELTNGHYIKIDIGWRRVMNYLRAVGLLCLLLVAVAAVLPMGALAQEDAPDESVSPGAKASSGDGAEGATKETTGEDLAPPETTGEMVGEDLTPPETTGETVGEDLTPPETTGETVGEDLTPPETTAETAGEDLAPPEVGEEAPADAPEDAPMEGTGSAETAVTEEAVEEATPAAAEGEMAESVGAAPEEEEEPEEELSTTDRIWREGKNPADYTWDPQTFSGFFYDLDDDVGTETLTVHLRESGDGYDRSIDDGKLEYETKADSIEFNFGRWGEYQVIGFMAQKYFAGYMGTDPDVVDKDISLLDEEELREVLIDDDEEYTVDTGSVLPLEEGYEFRIKEIDLDGNKVWLSLAKDGEEVDSKVIDPTDLGSSTYKYEVDLSGEDLPLVMLHVSNIFAGAESSLVTVDGIFQISDRYTTVASGDKYGDMEVDSISGDTIRMSNDNSITLRKGKTVPVMGDVSFLVADADELRFGPTVKRTGSYEIRGTIVDPSVDKFTWTPYNFEGFYYDIDDDVGTEELRARFTGDKIDDGDLEYTTEPESVEFEYSRWGSYNVIGFLAEKYFAGYNDDTEFNDEFSVINEGELRKVLIDDDESYTVRSGATFPLKEGYELRIKEVDLDGNKVYLSITKDGEEVDSKVIEPGSSVPSSTFTYDDRIGSEDVPIIAVHVQSVFRGREEDLATVEGIFQVSDKARSVEDGETYGKMKIDSVSDSGITMVNDGSFSLGKGKTISIMENMKFRVSDSDRRLVVPVVEVKAEVKPMRIDFPEVTVGTPAEIMVTSDGGPVIGALITINGDEAGTTDTDGIYLYSPKVAGSFDIEAKKDEYTDVKGVLVVNEIREERVLAISSPQEAMKGESFVVKVTIGLDQRPVEGADVAFDDLSIGTTDSVGAVSYASDAVGSHTITASKEGYESGSRKIVVTTPIEITGIEMDDASRTGKTVKITANAENRGSVSDTTSVELKVNGNLEGTENLTVGAGETGSLTFEYKPAEPGMYTVEVDGIQRTLTVEEKSNVGMIAGILVLLFAIGGGAYLYSTGKLNEILGQIKNR